MKMETTKQIIKYDYSNNHKQMIKDLIYLQNHKVKLKYYNEDNIKAFYEIEKAVFKAIDKLNIPFRVQNTIFYIIGDYIENKLFNTYENDIIKECLNILNQNMEA